uniref:DUF1279 domain-containing protein n=1 Tax=Anas platyrhynchos TaxID=8839 RepID=A0A8B9TFJ6_ANAPL
MAAVSALRLPACIGCCHVLPAAVPGPVAPWVPASRCRCRCLPSLLPPTLGLAHPQPTAGSLAKDVGGSLEKAATDLSSENKKLNKSQQLNKVFKECGAVPVSFHVGISSVSLGTSYLAVSSGVDMTAVLCKLQHICVGICYSQIVCSSTISITIVSVPFIVRYCRKIGSFKSPTPNP